jgi:hypothetical protein
MLISLARMVAGAFASSEKTAQAMFRRGFLAAGGDRADLSDSLAEEGCRPVLSMTVRGGSRSRTKAFIVEQADIQGRQFAQVASNGEQWARRHALAWHVAVLRRHGIPLGAERKSAKPPPLRLGFDRGELRAKKEKPLQVRERTPISSRS